MGSPKALLPWGRETLIEYQARALRAAGADPVVVVLGYCAGEVMPLVKGETVVVNERYTDGRASSLRTGAAALPDDSPAVIVLNVDQPRSADVLRRLMDQHTAGGVLITIPAHKGRRGHPPVLSGTLLPELRAAQEESRGLRDVIERHASEILEVEFDDPGVLLDINTPEEYEQARAQFEKVSR